MEQAHENPQYSPEILVIAIGWTHVTDSTFWDVKEYLGISLAEALKPVSWFNPAIAKASVALLPPAVLEIHLAPT